MTTEPPVAYGDVGSGAPTWRRKVRPSALWGSNALPAEVRVDIHVNDETVWVSVHDDGVGGADLGGGSGLIGLRDRVEPLGGDIQITSPPGEGTSLLIRIPMYSGTSGYGAGQPSNAHPQRLP